MDFSSVLKDGHTVKLRNYNNHHTRESNGQDLNTHAKAYVVAIALETFFRTHPHNTPMMWHDEYISQFGVISLNWLLGMLGSI